MQALKKRRLGLLALPLIAVAVVAALLAWSFTGPPAYAAQSTGITALDQQQTVDLQIPDFGSTTQLQQHEIVLTTDGDITGAPQQLAVTTDAQSSGKFDFSAIPKTAQDIGSSFWVMASIGAVLFGTMTIAGFNYVRSRTRRRQHDVPIAMVTTSTTPTNTHADLKQRLRMMGRVALRSLSSVIDTGWTWATTRTSQAKATRTSVTA